MLLQLKAIQKRFGGVVALRNGNLSVNPGEVHLLMGENGAGKSTLMKIVAGMFPPDGGEMLWRGSRSHSAIRRKRGATASPWCTRNPCWRRICPWPKTSFSGASPSRLLGWVNRSRMEQRAARLIEEHHFPLQPGWRVQNLSPAQKQLVEICRAIQHGSSLLIFDEPTSSLSESETKEVFRIVSELRERAWASSTSLTGWKNCAR